MKKHHYIIIGSLALVAVAGYLYYKNKSKAKTAAAVEPPAEEGLANDGTQLDVVTRFPDSPHATYESGEEVSNLAGMLQ